MHILQSKLVGFLRILMENWKNLKDAFAFFCHFLSIRIEIDSCEQVIFSPVHHWLSVNVSLALCSHDMSTS